MPGFFNDMTGLVTMIGTIVIWVRSIRTRKLVAEARDFATEGVTVSSQNSIAIEGVRVQVNGRVEQLLSELQARHEAELKAALATERAKNADPIVVAKKAAQTVRAARTAAAALRDAHAPNAKGYAGRDRRVVDMGPPKGTKERRKGMP